MTTAFKYLRRFGLPPSTEHLGSTEISNIPSNSEIKRWLEKGAVSINHKTPKPHDEITFPVFELVFFKHSKRVCTMVHDNWCFDLDQMMLGDFGHYDNMVKILR